MNLENADRVEGSLLTGSRGGLVDCRAVKPSKALIRLEMPPLTFAFVLRGIGSMGVGGQ